MRQLRTITIALAMAACFGAMLPAAAFAQAAGSASAGGSAAAGGLAAVPAWGWIVIAIVVVLLLIALFSRGRRKQAVIRTRLG